MADMSAAWVRCPHGCGNDLRVPISVELSADTPEQPDTVTATATPDVEPLWLHMRLTHGIERAYA